MRHTNVNTDLRHADHRRDPHATFDWLRREHPVYWNEALKGWVLTSYDDVNTIARSRSVSVEKIVPHSEGRTEVDRGHMVGIADVLNRWALFRDAPAHGRLRRPLNRVMRRSEMNRIRPGLIAVINRQIDAVAGSGRMELIADLAFPVPAAAIGAMLGVPEADTPKLRRWSVDLGTFVLIMPSVADRYQRAHAALGEMQDYFLSLIARYRDEASPSGISTLLEYADPALPEALSDEDIAAAAMLLLFAGHETTANLITNGMFALLKNPSELERLTASPTLIEGAVEEFLRFESPAQMIVRIAQADMQIGGQSIRAGDRIYAALQAANRDPQHFAQPDQLNIQRTNTDHMAFGHGMHFCVGAPLARMVAQATFEVLFARLTDFEWIGEEPEWHDALVVRAMKALPIGFRAHRSQP